MQPGSYNMSGMTSPVQNNNTMTSLTSSPYISSIMSDPCNLFSGNMDYGVIGTSDQPTPRTAWRSCVLCAETRCLDTTTVSSHASPARDSS